MIVITVITLLILTSAHTFQCPLSNKFQSVLFSGRVTIQPQKSSDDQNFDVDVPFKNSLAYFPIAALSMSSLSNELSTLIEFNFKVSKIEKYQFSFEFSSGTKSKWTDMGIQYLVSTRQDVEFGETQVSQPDYNYQDVFFVPYELKNYPTFSTQIRPFISGLQVVSQGSQFLGVKFEKYEASKKTIKFYFSSFSENSIVNYIKVTVVAFELEENTLLHTYNFVEKYNVEKKEEIDIKKNNIQSLESYLIGIISFEVSTSVPISIEADITNKFTLSFGSNYETLLQYIGISYLVLSQIQCGKCTGYPFIYKGQCRKSCPSNTNIQFSYCIPSSPNQCRNGYQRDQFGQCVPQCGLNAHFSSGHCICREGFYEIDGKCSKCQQQSQKYNYKSGKCENICGSHASYNYSDGRCYCYDDYYVLFDGIKKYCGRCSSAEEYDKIERKCIGQCKANQQKKGNQCQCESGFNRVSGSCIKCPKYSTFDNLFGTCICPNGEQYSQTFNSCIKSRDCGNNEFYSNGQCICKSGYNRISGKCSKCPQNSYFDQSTGYCECKVGYELSYGQCSPINRCIKDNEIQTSAGFCLCRDGYARNIKNDCVQSNLVCPQNQTRRDNECVCEPGYARSSDGFCYQIQCSTGQRFDQATNRCVPACSYGHQYSLKYLKCVPSCGQNEEWNGRQCVCKAGYRKGIYNLCTRECGVGQQRNNQGYCECKLGYKIYKGYCEPASCNIGQIWDPKSQKCIVRCRGSNQIWVNNKCVCISGYEFNQYGECEVKCPANEERVYGICRCVPGYYRLNRVCVRNDCLNNQIWDPTLNRCVEQCPANSHWNVYKCDCNDGFIRNNQNQCVRNCQQNQVLNQNGICVCKQFFHRQNGFCVSIICPIGQQYDLSLQKCVKKCSRPYEEWVGQVCVCINGYEPYGFNCVPVCGVNEERNNGRCVCKIGYIRNNKGICVSQFCQAGQIRNQQNQCVDLCPKDNQKWNSALRRCQCQTGYQRDQFLNCVLVYCPSGTQRNRYGVCVDICQKDNQIWDPNQNWCVCEENYVSDAFDKCVIVCPQGQRSNQRNQCVDICPEPNQRWKSTIGMCVCIDGYTKDHTYQCTRKCIKSYEQWNPTIGQCVCIDGFIRNPTTGFCYPNNCQQNEVLVQGKCVCQNGYYNSSGVCKPGSPQSCQNGAQYDPTTNGCICRSPKVWIFGKCVSFPFCPSNSFWNGQSCQCKWGYINRNNQCIRVNKDYICPPNSAYNGMSCLCDYGFYPVNNQSCKPCTPGTSWNGTNCTHNRNCPSGFIWVAEAAGCIPKHQCGNNEFFDGLTCRCLKDHYWINFTCTRCPSETYYDGLKCVSNNLVNKKCPGSYQCYNGRYCACIPGYFQTKKYCIKCPSHTVWNGYQCQRITNVALSNQISDSQNANTIPVKIING